RAFEAAGIHLGKIGVLVRRHIHQHRPAAMADTAEDAAMTARRVIAARPRIDFRDFARGESLLLLQHDDTRFVAALLVRPDAGADEVERMDDVLRPVIADLTLR